MSTVSKIRAQDAKKYPYVKEYIEVLAI